MSDVLGFAELLMGPTEIVGAANQGHPAVQRLDARSRMPTLAREARESRASGAIQALDKGRIEHASATRKLKPLLGPLQQTASHLARDLDQALVLPVLDHGANVQFGPRAQAGSTHPHRFFDLLAKGTPNAAWISCPPIGQDEQRAPRQRTAADAARISASANPLSRLTWTVPASQSRVDTIMAHPIHAMSLRPFTRISSACT